MNGSGFRTVIALLLLAGCSPEQESPPPIPEIGEAALHARAAFLSVAGTSAEDVWVVGAQPELTSGPAVLRSRDGALQPVEVPMLHDLWWVHAFESGPVFLGGGGATVLRYENDAFERTPTPVFFGNTVFGIWGAAPDDVWAVGGFAGRDGFAWRYDGAAWTEVELPADLPRSAAGNIPALFKVWGRGPDDVWMVGGLGTVLHFDGTEIRRIDVDTTTQLFTVAGDEQDVVIVVASARACCCAVESTASPTTLRRRPHCFRRSRSTTTGRRGSRVSTVSPCGR